MEQEHKPRTSMILLLEHVHAMDELTDEEFGAFVRNYAQYVETGLEPAYDNDRAMRMLWKVVKAFDDMNVQKMEERDRRRREANKKNINKRWNDKKYESIPMVSQDTNGIMVCQTYQLIRMVAYLYLILYLNLIKKKNVKRKIPTKSNASKLRLSNKPKNTFPTRATWNQKQSGFLTTSRQMAGRSANRP